MIDFTPVWNKIVPMNEFAASLSLTELLRTPRLSECKGGQLPASWFTRRRQQRNIRS
jgi:hypothetical protein